MINSLLGILFKLSYNQKLRVIAKKVFKYFPTLKSKLVFLRDNGLISYEKPIQYEGNNFLLDLKKEIIEHKGKYL